MPYTMYHSIKSLGGRSNISDIANLANINYSNKANFPDIKITNININSIYTPTILNNRCLFVINGYVSPSILINNEIYIPKSTISMLKSKENELGIVDFTSFNVDLVTHKLTNSMLTIDTNQPAYNRIIITVPADVQLPILSIAGYLVFEDNESFYRISDRSFILNLNRIGYINKLFELNKYRDIFTELGVPTINNGFGYATSDLKSDATILKLLTLHNSTLINLPVTGLNISKIYLDHSEVPGNFRTDNVNRYPIMLGNGRLANYIKIKSTDTKYTIYINNAHTNNLITSAKTYTQPVTHNDHRVPGKTYNLDCPYFLQIGK